MRFNPKARLTTRRMSDSGRSGSPGRSPGGSRGSSRLPIPGGMAAGGGITGVIVAVIVVALTMWLGDGSGDAAGYDASRMSDTDRYEHCETGADANEDVDCARVAVENSLYDYWSDTLPGFEPERLQTFTGGVQTGCGQASAAVGPFYCPADQTIYLDTTFFDDVLERQLGGPDGGFVEPYVLAHEYGHHLQNLMGTMGRVRTQQGPDSDAVRLELQADCYAGMWARAATTTEDADGNVLITRLTQEDIRQAIEAAEAVGDDRIQQRSGGGVDPDSFTHGSAEQRVEWFRIGYENRSLRDCDTFAADTL